MSNRRMIVFGLAIALTAAPLFWFDLDPSAGDKLLRWTSKQPTNSMPSR